MTHKNGYTLVIEPLSEEDGGGFLATVPDLPGCMSDGETAEAAVTNVQDAIRCWLDDQHTQQPPSGSSRRVAI